MKKTKDKKIKTQKSIQYQNHSQKIFAEKERVSKYSKLKVAKPQCHVMLNKTICKNKRKKLKWKTQQLLVQIQKFKI